MGEGLAVVKLNLGVVSRVMFCKSLIQFSTYGSELCSLPVSCLFLPVSMVGLSCPPKGLMLTQAFRTAPCQCPCPCGSPLLTSTSTQDPQTLTGRSAKSVGVTALTQRPGVHSICALQESLEDVGFDINTVHPSYRLTACSPLFFGCGVSCFGKF